MDVENRGFSEVNSKRARNDEQQEGQRQSGETKDVAWRQALFALAMHAKRRSEEELAAMTKPEIEVHLEHLETLWEEIELRWRELGTFVHLEPELDRIGQNYALHSQMYLEFKTRLRTQLSSIQPIGCSPITHSDGSAGLSIGPTGQTIQIQLPEPINVPQFSGRDEDWSHFRGAFVAEIHNNVRLNNAQKLRHLLNALSGRARNILGSSTLDCGENYEEAWGVLCNSYDNEYNTIQTHLRKIDALRPVQRPSCDSIRTVLDTTRSAHRQLRLMLTAERIAEHLLMHRIEALLDAETLSLWSLRRLPNTLPTLDKLFEFLELRASALMGASGEVVRVNDWRKTNVAPPVNRGDQQRPNCGLCVGEHHWPYNCVKFKAMSLRDRWAYVDDQGMCGNCFAYHKTNSCEKRKCPRCHSPHNSALCPANTLIKKPAAVTARRLEEKQNFSAATGYKSQSHTK